MIELMPVFRAMNTCSRSPGACRWCFRMIAIEMCLWASTESIRLYTCCPDASTFRSNTSSVSVCGYWRSTSPWPPKWTNTTPYQCSQTYCPKRSRRRSRAWLWPRSGYGCPLWMHFPFVCFKLRFSFVSIRVFLCWIHDFPMLWWLPYHTWPKREGYENWFNESELLIVF